MTDKAAIQNVAQIAVVAQDIERATAFYRDVLGLTLLFDAPGMAFFDCGGVRLMVSLPSDERFDHPASIIYYRVGDIDAAVARIEEAGARVVSRPHRVHATEQTELMMAFLEDSEGNTFALTSEREIQP